MPIVAFDPRGVDTSVSGNLALYLAVNNRCYNNCTEKVGQLHFHTHRLASLNVDHSQSGSFHPDTRDFAAYVYSCLIPRGYAVPPRAITFGHAHYKLRSVLAQNPNPAIMILDLINAAEQITVMSYNMRKDIPTLKMAFYMLLDINRRSIAQAHELRHHPVVKKYMSFENNIFKLKGEAFHPELINPLIPFLEEAHLLSWAMPIEGEKYHVSYLVTSAAMKLEARLNKSISKWIAENECYRGIEDVDGILITSDDFKSWYEHSTFGKLGIPPEGTLCRDLLLLLQWKLNGGDMNEENPTVEQIETEVLGSYQKWS